MVKISDLLGRRHKGERSPKQPWEFHKESPTLSVFTYDELDDMLARQAAWQDRQNAGVHEEDLPDRHKSDGEYLKEVFDYGELEPLAPDLLEYLKACPEEEWDQYFAYSDEEETILRAREDPNVFLEYCFRDKDGNLWHQQEFQREWQGLIPTQAEAKKISQGEVVMAYTSSGRKIFDEEGEHYTKSGTTLIVAPREHAKSTQICVGRTIWELGNNPNLRCRAVTANPALAEDTLYDVSQNIERNPRVKKVFPDLVPDYKSGWTKTAINVMRTAFLKDPSFEAVSVFSTGAGKRTDWLLFDDVVDFRNAIAQPSQRPMVKRAIGEVWMSTMPPDGRCVYTATPWHEDDATHHYKDSDGWTVWWVPAIREVTDPDDSSKTVVKVLWPDKWSLVALNIKKTQIGDREFARQYLLQTLSDDEATFPQHVIDRCIDPIRQHFGDNVPEDWPRVGGLDLAASMSKRGAWNVLYTFAIEPGTNRLVPYHMIRGKFDFTKFVNLIIELAPVMKWEILMVENNGYQQAMVSTLEQNRLQGFINVQAFRTGVNKADPEVGLPALAAVFGAGGFSIPDNTSHEMECLCDLCVWVTELRGHPTAKFSDTVMATWFAHRAAVQVGMNFIEGYHVYSDKDLKEAAPSKEYLLESIPSNVPRLTSNYTALELDRVIFQGAYDANNDEYS